MVKRYRSSCETTPHFPSPLWRKMVLEGRLALTPSHCPFFLGFASPPWLLPPHSSSDLSPGITSFRKSSQMPSSWVRHPSSIFPSAPFPTPWSPSACLTQFLSCGCGRKGRKLM